MRTGKTPHEAGVKRDIFIPEMALTRLMDEAILKYADLPCTEFLGREKTYAQIGREITRAAKGLQDMGVGPGSKIGLYMPNTPYYPVMFLAALKIGATVVNYDLSYTKEKLAAQIKDSGTTIMVTTELPEYLFNLEGPARDGDIKNIIRCPIENQLPFLKALGFNLKMAFEAARKWGAAPDIDLEKIVHFEDLVDNDGLYHTPDIRPDDLAVLQYTGGTTGTPKGAMLTHRNLVANMLQINEFFGAHGKDQSNKKLLHNGQETTLAALPYFHVYSMTVSMLMSMNIGAKISIIPDPQDLKTFVKTINKQRPSLVPVVPKLLRALLDKKDTLPAYKFDSVKVFISGGAALAPDLKREFEKATSTTVYQGYGLSETSPVVTGHSPVAANDDDSVGYALPSTQIQITDIDSDSLHDRRPLPQGQSGEICVKGPQVMRGYWKRKDDTNYTLRDGWLHTGDVGHIGTDGQLYITDRLKDMIVINGKKIFPVEVEKKILRHPAIADINIVNVPDKSTGEAAMAFIRFKDGEKRPSEAELRAFFDSIPLAKLEKPKHIVVWEEDLPKTRVGKPDKKELRLIAQKILAEREAASPSPAPKI